jgi:hypothetical protein
MGVNRQSCTLTFEIALSAHRRAGAIGNNASDEGSAINS